MKSFFDKSKIIMPPSGIIKYGTEDEINHIFNTFQHIIIKACFFKKMPKKINNNELNLCITNYNNESFDSFQEWNINVLDFGFATSSHLILNNKNIKANILHLSKNFRKCEIYINNFKNYTMGK